MEKWYDEAMERVTGWYKRYSQAFALILALSIALVLNIDTFEMGRALYRDQALRTSLVTMADDYIKQIRSDEKKAGEQPKDKPTGNSSSSAKQDPGIDKQKEGTTALPAGTKGSPRAKSPNPTPPAQTGQSGQSKPHGQSPQGAPEEPKLEKEAEKEVEKVNGVFKQISKTNLPIGWPVKIGNSAFWGLLTTQKFLGILLTALLVSLGSDFWFGLLSKLLNMRNTGKKPLTKEEQGTQKK